ncbi:uncharacterized protein LOC101742072 isoform X2 [Bombyx mori]|uniref:Ropporin-1-like protein n=1 Tax=Bombyx mori TaxID=7091 RepID=A0A8R2R7G7_BOMMO|nr:uncharacterized protein LOC101742072 isoform X3 [Bombyx mori]
MPELVEQMYCSEQIVIPPKYPYILKRYCKAAIKTQPYDLLRWSYEYFNALAQHRPPPVKLRLEYPVFTTEGGLTRGCLKVLSNQLSTMNELPLNVVETAWQGFCLDPQELARILCLCEVHKRKESVPYLHFMAVAGGLLTKSLTNTMVLLCEALTKEPDGGSAAIPVKDFILMYKFLATIDASRDVKYYNGYREGHVPESDIEPEEETQNFEEEEEEDGVSDDYWPDEKNLQMLPLINDKVSRTTRLSLKLNMPIIGKIERSPSVERAETIERENYMRERKGRPVSNEDIEKKLREMSSAKLNQDAQKEGMVAGRQMSTTSGEFIVQHVEKEIMEYIDEQIAVLPDPDLKKKKAKPEEVEMLRGLLDAFIDETMEILAPEVEEAEEEEQPVPEVIVVYAVPGIGGPVDEATINDFIDYALDVSKVQNDLFMPRNVRHFLCPPLEKFKDVKYDTKLEKEEIPTGGVFTD